jgi:glutamate dehydrogenase (NAD(P)+)
MQEIPKDKNSFNKELAELRAAFDALEPELAVTLRDEALDLEGHIVVWNTNIAKDGPLGRCGKGGTRITPTLTLEEVKMLARIMALKNAAAGLPLGGAKSGIKADPDAPDFEKKYRRFAELSKPYLRENGGIFGGFGFDIGAREQHPLWVCDELKSFKSFTGKPVHLGGTDYDVEGCAGLGVAVAAKVALEQDGVDLKNVTFAVQGGGAMGAAVIRYFSEFGASIQSIAEPICGGTFIFEKQIPDELLTSLSHRDHNTTIRLLKEGKYPEKEIPAVIYQDVDVLFPSALQNVITKENAHLIKAKYVVEGANGPCTDEARSILYDRGITVIPDFIANPGGIIAAFVELTSNATPEENAKTRINVIKAKEYIREKISANVSQMLSIARKLDVEPRHAGMLIALKAVLGR